MKRRNFLETMVGGIALGAAVRSWPFRVYSFAAPVERIHVYDIYSMLSEIDCAYGIKDLYRIRLDDIIRFPDGTCEIYGKRYHSSITVPPRTKLGKQYLAIQHAHELDLFRDERGTFMGQRVLSAGPTTLRYTEDGHQAALKVIGD